jgi:hypothetical protein
MKKFTKTIRILAIAVSIVIVFYIFFVNTVPFSISKTYTSNGKDSLVLLPKDRIENSNGISQQKNDLVYFNSKMPFKFDHAKVRVVFKNPSLIQKVQLGYKDKLEWHYNTQTMDEPLIDNIKWPKIGTGPYLYQKSLTYNSFSDFAKKPPNNMVVGTYDYNSTNFLQTSLDLPSYQPAHVNTSIDVALRGKTTMYVYLKNEPFNMSFTKKDLNWYADPDVAKISVYKSKDKVFDATIDDDGNSKNNQKAGEAQTINIKNPGPGLPENGVYKVIIDTPIDSLITNITTNLNKIVFEGPLYVADNHEVYPDAITKTKPTKIFTNAQKINLKSDHEKSNVAFIDDQSIGLPNTKQIYAFTSIKPTSTITLPKSDITINGSGYFSFSKDQFFAPSPYKILPINSADDINQSDYVITNYKGVKKQGDQWSVAEREFDISDAFIQDKQLSWVLAAPGLSANNNSVEYKLIEITLYKKGWLKQ